MSLACARARPMTTWSSTECRWKPGTAASRADFSDYRETAEQYAFLLNQLGV